MEESIENGVKLLRVSGHTNVGKLAGSIYASVADEKNDQVTLRVIGAGALNQAVKGLILANKQFSKIGKAGTFLPYFTSFDDNVTAIELRIKMINQ